MIEPVFHTIRPPVANLTEILESGLFLWGLALGALCLVAVLVGAAFLRGQRPFPVGGLSMSMAALLAWTLGGESSALLWTGLLTVVTLTALAAMASARPGLVALASVPGAIVLAFAVPADPWWFRFVILLSIPVAGLLVDEFDTRYRDLGLGTLFYGLACLGSFLAVPDTELPRALMAVAFPIMFLAWPRATVCLGRTGSYAAVAVLAVSTVTGAVGRSASVIGAMACLGLLVLEPIMTRARPRLASLPNWLHHTPEAAVMAVIPQVVWVFVAARVAGLMDSIASATITIVILAAVFASLLLWVEKRRIPAAHDL